MFSFDFGKMSTILFLVLTVFAGLQLRLRPFHYRLSNLLEIFAMVVLIFNLISILSSSSASSTPTAGELMAMKIIVLLANLVYILVLVIAVFYGAAQLFLPEQWRKTMQASRSMKFLGRFEEKSSISLRSPSRVSVSPWEETRSSRSSLSLRMFLGSGKEAEESPREAPRAVPTFIVARSMELKEDSITTTTSGE